MTDQRIVRISHHRRLPVAAMLAARDAATPFFFETRSRHRGEQRCRGTPLWGPGPGGGRDLPLHTPGGEPAGDEPSPSGKRVQLGQQIGGIAPLDARFDISLEPILRRRLQAEKDRSARIVGGASWPEPIGIQTAGECRARRSQGASSAVGDGAAIVGTPMCTSMSTSSSDSVRRSSGHKSPGIGLMAYRDRSKARCPPRRRGATLALRGDPSPWRTGLPRLPGYGGRP
jgi:hypothetical protein